MNTLPQFEHILAIEDRKNKRLISLKKEVYSLGRDPHNTIVICGRQVSRRHATLLRKNMPKDRDYSFWIVDGDLEGHRSTNGLLINGKYCLSHKLKIGDAIVLGDDTRIKYYKLSSKAVEELLKPGERLSSSVLDRLAQKNDDLKKTLVSR